MGSLQSVVKGPVAMKRPILKNGLSSSQTCVLGNGGFGLAGIRDGDAKDQGCVAPHLFEVYAFP